MRGVVWLENRDGGRSSVYSTTLRRNRTENFTRRFTVDTTHRRLHLDFLDFREKPLRPSVTVTGLEIDYIPHDVRCRRQPLPATTRPANLCR